MANPIPNLFRAPELKKKILFTLLMMFVYRIGSHITVPGIDVGALQAWTGQLDNTFLGVYDMFVGGGLSRATIFALGIMPYISASIMFQLLAAVFPTVEKLQKEGEEGRKKLTQWTRYTTVLLCVVQAYAYSSFLQNIPDAVNSPGLGFAFTTVVVLTVGGVFIMWMGEQITERGLGNGMSLMIFFSIIQGFPAAAGRTWESVANGEIGLPALIALLVVIVGITAGVVAMTMAARKIPIQIPRKVVGRGRIREGQKSFIPLRVNSAGVMPIIFAQSIMFVPGTFSSFFPNMAVFQTMVEWFQPGAFIYNAMYGLLIVFFTYFYTSIIFNPVDVADNMKRVGGFIPGIRPGKRTADYLDHILTRITLPGSVFLAIIAIVPFLIIRSMNVSLSASSFFGGTALLIVVGVALDTLQQIESHLVSRHYEGFMKRGRVRGRAG
jgi:preprotein translocase subunit SecY